MSATTRPIAFNMGAMPSTLRTPGVPRLEETRRGRRPLLLGGRPEARAAQGGRLEARAAQGGRLEARAAQRRAAGAGASPLPPRPHHFQGGQERFSTWSEWFRTW